MKALPKKTSMGHRSPEHEKMLFGMGLFGIDNLKVFYPVIRFISVFVVNQFGWQKIPTKRFLHDQSMFKNIFSSSHIHRMGMIGSIYSHIAGFVGSPTTFPSRMFRSLSRFAKTTERTKLLSQKPRTAGYGEDNFTESALFLIHKLSIH